MTRSHSHLRLIQFPKDTITTDLKKPKIATRLAFFIAGFALSSWAPLVPFAQARLQIEASGLGGMLLCLGLGAIIGMPLAGALSTRLGPGVVIAAASACLALILPLLAVLTSPWTMGASLLLFGLAVGAIDVAANIHGAEVQRRLNTPLMSGFHGMYSLGALLGVLCVSGMISAGIDMLRAALLAAALIVVCLLLMIGGFLRPQAHEQQPHFVMPRGLLLLIGVLMGVIFLVEGAMLDWAGILMVQTRNVDVAHSGFAYTAFACAMLIARLSGDKVVARAGRMRVVIAGCLFTAVGIAIVALAPRYPMVLAGAVLAGLAVGNLVPILFSLAAAQRRMPSAQAIAAVSMLGYSGVLVGPALIGIAAQQTGYVGAFIGLVGLMIVTICVFPVVVRKTG